MSMNQKTDNKGSRIARLSAARLAAVQAVYQMKANEQSASDVISEFKAHRLGKPVDDQNMVLPDGILFTNIVSGMAVREADLLGVIDTSLAVENERKSTHSLDSLDLLLQCILLCGAYELLAHHDVDAPIIISDYLAVTHAFYEGGEAKLVNAVLDSVKKALRDS